MKSGGNWGIVNRAVVKGIGPQGGVLVEVPAFAPGGVMGPIPTVVPNLAIGESVLVASISTSRDTLVVIGRVPGRASTIDEIPALAATIAALQSADSSAASRLTTAEGRLNTHDTRFTTDEGLISANTTAISTHVHTSTPGNYAVGGNETVTGTLAAGATTVASLNAGSGAVTTTGAVNAGTVVASGAASAASYTATGSLSAEATKFTTATVSADLIRAAARFNPPAGALGGAAARDVRQPVVHAGSGAISVTPTTEVALFTFLFTPRSDCNPRVHLHFSGFCSVAGGAVAGTTGQINIRTKIIKDSDSSVILDAGFSRNMYAIVATNDKRARAEPNFILPLDCALVAATTYRLAVSAQADVNLSGAVTVDGWAASVMEVARAV